MTPALGFEGQEWSFGSPQGSSRSPLSSLYQTGKPLSPLVGPTATGWPLFGVPTIAPTATPLIAARPRSTAPPGTSDRVLRTRTPVCPDARRAVRTAFIKVAPVLGYVLVGRRPGARDDREFKAPRRVAATGHLAPRV